MRAERRHAVIRADAGAAIGGGHVMRCLALAEALAADGWRITFAGTAETPITVAALASSRHGWVELARFYDPVTLPCDLLVVDHYGLDAGYEAACRPAAGRILVLDDLPGRPHDCDVLLDQTLGRDPADYAVAVPAGCTILAGSTFALLRPQFAAARLTALPVGPIVGRVLLTLGTTDPARALVPAINALRAALPGAILDVVVGSAAPHLDDIRVAIQSTGARLHVDLADMAGLMAQADLAVAAAGSVTWELCALARPMILMQIAANQAGIMAAMGKAGAADILADSSDLGRVASALAADHSRREALAAAAGQVCDGRGAARIALALCPEIAADGAPVTLRPATMDDSLMVLEWQRAPETRRFARNPAIPAEAEHLAWMGRRLADPNCLFNIVRHGTEPAGVVRLDLRPGGSFEISIFMAPAKHRLGLGLAALRLARRLVPGAVLDAQVHPDNVASQTLFLRAGYRPEGEWYRSPPVISEPL